MSKPRVFSGTMIDTNNKCKECEKKDECTKSNQKLTAYGILLDCEGFYYVFSNLEKIEERPKISNDIEQNRKEIDEYIQKRENIPFLTPPLVTNGALALELAMKFLIFYENKKFECGHNLAVLFSQIPEVHRKVLMRKIYQEMFQNEITFNDNIRNIANIFTDYRYFFEHESIGYSSFFTDLVHLVCDYAISMKDNLRY